MSHNNELPTEKGQYEGVVTPVKRRETRGTEYGDEFKYTKVHVESGTKDALSDKANIARVSDVIFYRYRDKPPVMISEVGVHYHEEYSERDTEEQAFFVLSMLASEGYVSNWSKK